MNGVKPERDTRGRGEQRTVPFAWSLAAVAVVAFVVRAVDLLTHAAPWSGDPVFYHVQANLIADGYGFAEPIKWLREGTLQPSAFHPPLFSLILSATSHFGGTSYAAHQWTAALIGVGTVVIVGLLGREVAGRRVGLIAAFLAAVYPNLWLIDARLWSEGLAAGFTALALLCCYRLRRRKSVGAALLLGLALGGAGLSRPETLLLLVLVAIPIALLLRDQAWGRRFLLAGVTVIATVAVLAPWVVRNLATFERPVPFSTSGDFVVSVSNCQRTYYTPGFLGYWAYECSRYRGRGDESEIAERARQKGVQYLLAHKRRFVTAVVWARIGRVWDLYAPHQNARISEFEGRETNTSFVGLYMYWAVLPFALAGVFLLHRQRKVPVWPLLMELAAVTIVAAYGYGAVRFRAPAETVLLVLAAVGLRRLWERIRRRTSEPLNASRGSG